MKTMIIDNHGRKAYRFATMCRMLTVSAMIFFAAGSTAQQTYSFTTAGATGRFGPTQVQINTAYGSTNLSGMVTSNSGIQHWTVPVTGNYRITAAGAGGGLNMCNGSSTTSQPGKGAVMEGEFFLTSGTVLKILVGQVGPTYNGTCGGGAGGGGGGSYVTTAANTAMIVAGGGNGANWDGWSTHGPDGLITNTGTGGGATNRGGGGGGFVGDGAAGTNLSGGGYSFLNGGNGGDFAGSTYGVEGAFGGGGASNHEGGGGGGYKGGDVVPSNQYTTSYPTYGAGSYNNGTNQNNQGATNVGNGYVIIKSLCDVEAMATANPICEGDAVTISTNAGSNIQWSTGASTSSILVSPQTTTSYTVSGVSSSTSACSSTVVITVSVNPLPDVFASGVPSVVCAGSTATLNASGAGTYSWSNSTSGWSTTVAPPSTSVYTVTGTDANSCKSQATVEVNVNTNSLTVTPPVTICSGSSQSLTASGGASSTSYTWFPQANFPTIIVSPTVTTTYVVAATDMHNCMITNSVEVTVVDKPSIIASVDRDQICRGESVTLSASGGDNYTWSNGVTGQTNNVKLNADITYTFAVTGSNSQGCTGTGTIAVVVEKCTGLEKSSAPGRMSISPNPSPGIFQLTFEKEESRKIRVTDLTGKVVCEKKSTGSETEVDLSDLPGGVYSVQVISASSSSTHKLIKE